MISKVKALSPLVQSLLHPGAYPHSPSRVELAQTHISFIFLAGDYVYKVKKPVDFGFLDFTTLERRRLFCHREVELNRRLCPDIYLGVAAIVREGESFRMEGDGEAVEYAVKMRRLPEDRMMGHLLRRGEVTPAMVADLARKLARFHDEAEAGPEIARLGGMEAVKHNTEENFAQTQSYVGLALSREDYQAIVDYTRGFLGREALIFRRRARQGRIRDGHGDVHSANICLADGIYIYDCIEFNDRFRYGDVAQELAFLAMDLDYYGHPDLSRVLVEAYVQASGDRELPRLLNFFKVYRAYVRGKVKCIELDDSYVSSEEKRQLLEEARRYFSLARSYIQLPPALVITAGLIGAGKSSLAQALAQRAGVPVLSSDIVRKELAGLGPEERRPEPWGQGIYSPEFTRRTYRALFCRAGRHLRQGRSLILDASFSLAQERRRARGLAQRLGAELWVMECRSPDAALLERLERPREGPSDAQWELLAPMKAAFQPVVEVSPERHLVVDTSGPLEDAVAQVQGHIPQLAPLERRRE